MSGGVRRMVAIDTIQSRPSLLWADSADFILPKQETHRDGGLTLVELLVVIAIIAIIGGVGLPLIAQSMDNAHVRYAAQKITDTLRWSRETAIADDANVQFSANQGCAWQVTLNGVAVPEESMTAAQFQADFGQRPQCAFTGGDPLSFNPTGLVSGAYSVQVGGAKTTWTIQVSPTGTIQLGAS